MDAKTGMVGRSLTDRVRVLRQVEFKGAEGGVKTNWAETVVVVEFEGVFAWLYVAQLKPKFMLTLPGSISL
jgi:hypothetical protein